MTFYNEIERKRMEIEAEIVAPSLVPRIVVMDTD